MTQITASSATSSKGSPAVVSQKAIARLFLVFVVLTVVFHFVYLLPIVPEIPIHENHYFFNEDGHVPKSSHALNNSGNTNNRAASKKQKSTERPPIADWMRENAGIEITPAMEAALPTWDQVREVVGDAPVVLGLETCQEFRNKVPPLERMLGSAGMFNTGTNLVTRLLKENCEIPERREKSGPHQSKESYGMRWQVPWGKHTPVKFRRLHSTQKAADIHKEWILPVVTTRHPYSWFGSMCKSPYTAKWDHKRTKKGGETTGSNSSGNRGCPRLKQAGGPWNPVTVTYAEKRQDHHLSLAHLWNDWYSYYINYGEDDGGGDFPYLIVRMEDLVFYPEETLHQVCECAGGKIGEDQKFKLITNSAKGDSQGHDTSTGIYEAWIKYSRANTKERYGFSEADYADARAALDGDRMEALGYKHPT